MKTVKVRVTFFEELLGSQSNNPNIQADFISSKAPDAASRDEEIADAGAGEAIEESVTVFPRDENGNPFMYDYQWKGFFKEACSAMRKATGSKSASLKAYKKEIDKLIFPKPRKIEIHYTGNISTCQRPLRGQTAQGERIALANSEAIPAGAWCEFEILTLNDSNVPLIHEWMDYGELGGTGQWRNSGKGRFTVEYQDQ